MSFDKFENNQRRTCTTFFRTSKLTEVYFNGVIVVNFVPYWKMPTEEFLSSSHTMTKKSLSAHPQFLFLKWDWRNSTWLAVQGNMSFWLVNRNAQLHTQTLDSLSKREVFIVIPWKNSKTIFVLLLTVYLIPIKGPWYTNLYLAPYTNDN